MPPITDPDVTTFVNQVVRPFADAMIGLNSDAEVRDLTWNNTITQNAAWIAAAGTDLIEDGSESDGRTQLTKSDVLNFWTQVGTFMTQMNGAGVAGVVAKPMVNPRSPTS